MILDGWRCAHCGWPLYPDGDDWICSACSREYTERNGALVPVVQAAVEQQVEANPYKRKRHTAGWRERMG